MPPSARPAPTPLRGGVEASSADASERERSAERTHRAAPASGQPIRLHARRRRFAAPQQVQPQDRRRLQVTGTHWPLLQISPQPQAGVQALAGQMPFVHLPPPAQPQVPPQPSPPPQVPSVGQLGLQQLPP